MSIFHDIKKEIRYGIRNGRFLILAAGFLFFALLTPFMMKVVMPELLKSQFPDMSSDMLAKMINLTQVGSVKSYMGDVFEIGTIIVVFTLCGIMGQEIKDNTLVIPICSGKKYSAITGAKLLVFGFALIFILTLSLLANYLYSGLLIGFDLPSAAPILKGGLLQGFYMVFLLSCVIMFGALIKKPIAAGILTLVIGYGLPQLSGLLHIEKYVPSGLINEALSLSEKTGSDLTTTVVITLSAIVIFFGISVFRLKKMELNER